MWLTVLPCPEMKVNLSPTAETLLACTFIKPAGHKVIEGVQRSAVYLVEKDDPRSLYVLKKLGRLKYRLAVLDAVNAQQGRHRVRHRTHVVLAAFQAEPLACEQYQLRLSCSGRAREKQVVMVVDECHRHLPPAAIY